jgi:hypothetical protein
MHSQCFQFPVFQVAASGEGTKTAGKAAKVYVVEVKYLIMNESRIISQG